MGDFDKAKYTAEYIKKHIRQFMFKLSRIYDEDMIKWLESKDNVNEYLKSLVQKDMEESGHAPE